MNPKISVIVAIYNAEKYLYRCLNSLAEQTFEDYEVLLIDDGSPDSSGNICDRFAKKYPFMRVIHKKNGGVSSARQCGIDHAQGEYTIHVDADDWVEPNMLEELYQKAKQEDADMVICDYFEIKLKERYVKQEPTALTADIVLKNLLTSKLMGYCWNKLIKRACYNDYNLTFPANMILEDLFVVCRLCLNNIHIVYLNKAFYHYDRTINKESLSLNYNEHSLVSRIAFISYMEKELPQAYQEELNSMKCSVKKIAWCSQAYSKEDFINLYKEINKVYPRYQKCKSPISISVWICLSGHYKIAKFMLKTWLFIRRFLCRCGILPVNFYTANGK
ncbi:glycosyltransferase [Bacteroides sp. An51A]|uniref:glycosyltransferase family 2 protein n=1 Tax=Bacteroides sp. An51A TaxID=1965640 RepID=UPI000B39AE48|nr:glycosyltransferase [Bacteroides sp. An51A]OUN81526.1 hypothetical protein B5G04_04425 [Bacteroides sp. An51A]